jgi:hypothetical protein
MTAKGPARKIVVKQQLFTITLKHVNMAGYAGA